MERKAEVIEFRKPNDDFAHDVLEVYQEELSMRHDEMMERMRSHTVERAPFLLTLAVYGVIWIAIIAAAIKIAACMM